MKKLILNAFIIIVLVSCGGESSTNITQENSNPDSQESVNQDSGKGKNNGLLGEFPSITKTYKLNIDEKEKKVKECTDIEKALELSKELNLLEKEGEEKIQEYLDTKKLEGTVIPVETISGLPYTINKAEINLAQPGNLNIKFTVKIDEDIKNKYGGLEKTLFVYYKALDSKGNEITGTKTVATNFQRIELTTGTNYEAFGSWNSSDIVNMEDFAKIKQISKEEYNEK